MVRLFKEPIQDKKTLCLNSSLIWIREYMMENKKTCILSQKEIKINSCHGRLCIEIALMLLAIAH